MLMVKVFHALTLAWATEPKSMLAGATAVGVTVKAPGWLAVPDMVVETVSPEPVAVTVSVAVLFPAEVGAKPTVMVHVLPAAGAGWSVTVVQVSSMTAKSPLLGVRATVNGP